MKAHIIGIAGKATSAIAVMLQQQGWIVSGSDSGAYPPASTFLQSHGIQINAPYAASNLPESVDLVMIGGNVGVDPNNPEIHAAMERGLEILTYPQVLERFVVKPQSIVVVGNFGKGTISGAIVKALYDLGEDPSYMVGGQMVDFDNSVNIGATEWSVMEGDEYPAPPLVTPQGEVLQREQSKFFFYHPKYVVFTSAEWDHFDKFPTEQEYKNNYRKFLMNLPKDAVVIANLDGEGVAEVVKDISCKVVTYSAKSTDSEYQTSSAGFEPVLFGNFNLSNLTAAYALLSELGFDKAAVKKSLESYRGLKQRMEILIQKNETVVIRDLAHSPVKAQEAISAVRSKFPEHTLVTIFDIYASSLKNRQVLPKLHGRFSQADVVIIPKVNLSAHIAREEMVTGKEISEVIAADGATAIYAPTIELIVDQVAKIPAPKAILLMSSGNLGELEERIIASI